MELANVLSDFIWCVICLRRFKDSQGQKQYICLKLFVSKQKWIDLSDSIQPGGVRVCVCVWGGYFISTTWQTKISKWFDTEFWLEKYKLACFCFWRSKFIHAGEEISWLVEAPAPWGTTSSHSSLRKCHPIEWLIIVNGIIDPIGGYLPQHAHIHRL